MHSVYAQIAALKKKEKSIQTITCQAWSDYQFFGFSFFNETFVNLDIDLVAIRAIYVKYHGRGIHGRFGFEFKQ
jgi:hypothetical protein